MRVRTGIGYDIHRLAEGRPLRLGGVGIPGEVGLLGHSDADVVLHALCDALLGAAGQPDIGELFSNRDPQWRDADSRRFVEVVQARIHAAGWRVGNVDLIIQAERPHLGRHKQELAQSIAALLGVPVDAVGVKAGTNEGLDAVGHGAAIACWASVLLLGT
jgi:2-C-methyl-D-erythritol 2,4-cyclodiphosphate synthase